MACPLADSFCKYVRVSQYFAQGNEYGWSPYWVRNEYGTFRNARVYQYKLIVRRVRKKGGFDSSIFTIFKNARVLQASLAVAEYGKSPYWVRIGFGSFRNARVFQYQLYFCLARQSVGGVRGCRPFAKARQYHAKAYLYSPRLPLRCRSRRIL